MATLKKIGRPKSFERERALARALDLFLEKNYQGASLADLLASMGIARQSLYNTFGSKHELFLEAFHMYETQAITAYQNVFDGQGSPLGKLEMVVRGWGERAKQRPFGGCLINAAAVDLGRADPKIADLVRKHFRQLTWLLRDSIQNAVSEGELMLHVDPLALARMLVIHCQGLIVMGHAGVEAKVIDDATEFVLGMLPGA